MGRYRQTDSLEDEQRLCTCILLPHYAKSVEDRALMFAHLILMDERVSFADTLNGLPSIFLKKEYSYKKADPPCFIKENRANMYAKQRVLMASRVWPACADYGSLTRRIETAHWIRKGKSYKTMKNRRRRINRECSWEGESLLRVM